jgi:hypothetical protein
MGGANKAWNAVSAGVDKATSAVKNFAEDVTPEARLASDERLNKALEAIQAQRQQLQSQATAQGTQLFGAQNYNTSAIDILQGAASGNAPSRAQGVLQQGLDQSIASQFALAQSGNLSQQVAGQKQAQSNIAQMTQQTANEAGMLRAQEMAAAREGFASQAGKNLGQQQGYMNALNSAVSGTIQDEAQMAQAKYNADTNANQSANLYLQKNNPWSGLTEAAAAAAGSISSKDYKEDKKEIKENKALEAILNMPVEKWKYKKGIADESEHIGPYAEDFKKETGMGSGKDIQYQDSIGLIMKAIQDLNAKIDNIKGK